MEIETGRVVRRLAALGVAGLLIGGCGELTRWRGTPAEAGMPAAELRPGDALAPELRTRVDRLVASVATTPTSVENVGERLETLWAWGNARGRAGLPNPPNLTLAVAIGAGQRALAQRAAGAAEGDEVAILESLRALVARDARAPLLFGLTDAFIRDLALRDADPEALGRLRSSTPGPFEAASFQTIEQTWTVGSRDLAPGGSLMVAQHFMANQGRYQTEDPAADHYVSIQSSRPEARFVAGERLMFGMHGGFRRPAPNLVFELVEGRLTRGDTVTITYGDRSGGSRGFRVQSVSNDAYPLPLYVAFEDGDPGFLLGPQTFEVIGAEAVRVHGFVPAIVAVGEAFELRVRAEDRFFNRASGTVPAVDVLLDGQRIVHLPAGEQAIRSLSGVRIPEPGLYRFAFRSTEGAILGESDPIRVREDPAYRIYWGDTHGHSGFAEGQGSIEGYFRFGRDDARLDFLTLSEHDVWMDDGEWEQMRDAVERYREEGRFIPYLGYEYTVDGTQGGHHNVLFRTAQGRERIPVQEYPLLPELYRGLRAKHAVEDVLIIPHAHQAGDWRIRDADLENLVEIMSLHGSFEWFGEMYLRHGHAVGFIAASDDHLGHPGYTSIRRFGFAHRGGLAAVLAPAKTTDAIFYAMKNRAAYATTSDRILLEVSVNGARMGSVIPPGGPRRIVGEVAGTAPIDTITVIKNGEIFWSRDFRSRRALPEDGRVVAEVVFRSPSHSVDYRHDNPRGWRPWEGTLEVEGASLLGIEAGFYNPLLPPTRIDPDRPSRVRFTTQTRGETNAVRLMLEGTSRRTRLAVDLEAVRERPTAPARHRPAQNLPAQRFALDFGALRDGRLVHEIPADAYTDTVSLRLVRPDAPLDQRFEVIDTSPARVGDYYYVRVEQANAGVAWSSPVWVGEAGALDRSLEGALRWSRLGVSR